MNTQKTTVDWLRFRAQAEPRDVLEALKPMYPHTSNARQGLSLVYLDRGLLGFKQGAAICFGAVSYTHLRAHETS
jgi:hypothetical protein